MKRLSMCLIYTSPLVIKHIFQSSSLFLSHISSGKRFLLLIYYNIYEILVETAVSRAEEWKNRKTT